MLWCGSVKLKVQLLQNCSKVQYLGKLYLYLLQKYIIIISISSK